MTNEEVLKLFDAYSEDAFRLAYAYLGSRPDAEDIVQDVFVKLIKSDITINKGKEKDSSRKVVGMSVRCFGQAFSGRSVIQNFRKTLSWMTFSVKCHPKFEKSAFLDDIICNVSS